MRNLKQLSAVFTIILLTIHLAPANISIYGLRAAQAAGEISLGIPATTHGFTAKPGLPNGDLFLLPQSVQLTVTQNAESAAPFAVSNESFGSTPQEMGALPEITTLKGLALAEPEHFVRALTSADSFAQGNFVISATPGSVGDTVRLFLHHPDGTGVQDLLVFTVQEDGLKLTDKNNYLRFFVDNRFGLGPDTQQDAVIPFADAAGAYGQRTGLLTFTLPAEARSPLRGCFQLGMEIKRAQQTGTTALIFTDLAVNRERVAGDESNTATGLLGELSGGYPSGAPCENERTGLNRLPASLSLRTR